MPADLLLKVHHSVCAVIGLMRDTVLWDTFLFLVVAASWVPIVLYETVVCKYELSPC